MAGFKPLFIVSAWPKYVPQDSKYNKRKKEKNDDKNGFALFKVTTKPKVKVFDDESIMFQFQRPQPQNQSYIFNTIMDIQQHNQFVLNKKIYEGEFP